MKNVTMSTQATFRYNEFENYTFKIIVHLPGAKELTAIPYGNFASGT